MWIQDSDHLWACCQGQELGHCQLLPLWAGTKHISSLADLKRYSQVLYPLPVHNNATMLGFCDITWPARFWPCHWMGHLAVMTRLRWGINHLLTCTGGGADLTSLQEWRSVLAAFLCTLRHWCQLKVIQTLEEGMGGVGSSFELPGVPRVGSLH